MIDILNEPDSIDKYMRLKDHRANSSFGGQNDYLEANFIKSFDLKNVIAKEIWLDADRFTSYVCAYNDKGTTKYVDFAIDKETQEIDNIVPPIDLKKYS